MGSKVLMNEGRYTCMCVGGLSVCVWELDRQRSSYTDRQINRLTGKQAGKHTDRQADI